MALGLAFLSMVAVFFLVIGIYNAFFSTKEAIRNRMNILLGSYGLLRKITETERDDTGIKDKFRESLKYGKLITSKSLGNRLEQELQKANIPLRGYEFVMISLASAGGMFFIGILLRRPLFVAIVLGILGLFLPWLYVKMHQRKRLNAFNAQICDTLMLMSNSLKAGHGIMQALEMVAKEMSAPMSEEYARMLKEMSLGVSTEEALENMAARIGNDDWDMTVTAILIQRQIGGSLSEILDNISETIRERIRIKGEIQTLTAQGRLSGFIIGVLPLFIGLVLLIMNPPYLMTLWENEYGRYMLYAAMVSEIIGFLLIQKIVNIKI